MAGLIPKQFIDDLLTRIDIVEVIDERVPLKKAGKDYKACCPFHDEKTPSFTVSADKQFYHCFGCGAHGTAIGFLMEYEHLSFPEAVEDLARRAGLEVPHEGGARAAPQPDSANLVELLREAARYYCSQLRDHPQAGMAVDYLKRRGITGEVAKDFELGFAPDGWDNLVRALGKDDAAREAMVIAGLAVKKEGGGFYDRFRARVMFPIHDHRGRIVGFGGRVIDKGEPKYLNSPETPLFHKGRELYGLFRAREAIKDENRVLVVEGYMDVVALAQFGVNFAVATLGTATTREHLERLYRHAPEVVFCFDGDRAGREAAWRALENALPVLHEGRQASFLFLPEGEDPDTLVRKEGAEAYVARTRAAMPLPDYLFQTLSAQVDLGRLDGRARLVELARPHLSKLAPGVLQQMMIQRLAELSRMDSQKLTTLMKSQGPVPGAMAGGSVRKYAGNRKEPPSTVRLAIALLLQNPKLAPAAPMPGELDDLDLPGVDLFLQITAVMQSSPELNTAALLEHFRGTEAEQTLLRLTAWQHPALESPDLSAEFQGVVDKLRKDAVKRRTERLLQKEQAEGLSPLEKAELTRLLARKVADSGHFQPPH
jgi:DNA primase